jgi:hypothetical protein
VPTFADRGYHVVSVTNPHGSILGFLDRSRYYFFQAGTQEAEWTPFQTQYFSENLVAPVIEPGIPGYVTRSAQTLAMGAAYMCGTLEVGSNPWDASICDIPVSYRKFTSTERLEDLLACIAHETELITVFKSKQLISQPRRSYIRHSSVRGADSISIAPLQSLAKHQLILHFKQIRAFILNNNLIFWYVKLFTLHVSYLSVEVG